MGKTILRVDCVDQRLFVAYGPLIASGGVNEDEIEFNFCPLWEGYGKTAVFYRTLEDVYNVPVVDGRCVIPREVLADKGEFYFGVFGTKDAATRTTEVIKYSVAQGAMIPGGKPAAPTPDIYAQIMSAIGSVESRMTAEGVGAVPRTGGEFTGRVVFPSDGIFVRNRNNSDSSDGGHMVFESGNNEGNVAVYAGAYAGGFRVYSTKEGIHGFTLMPDGVFHVEKLTVGDADGARENLGAADALAGEYTIPHAVARKAVDDLLTVVLDDDLNADVMKPAWFGTEDASTLANSPVGSGPFYGMRYVYRISHQTLVELIESYPQPGRRWSRTYDPNYKAWIPVDGWAER